MTDAELDALLHRGELRRRAIEARLAPMRRFSRAEWTMVARRTRPLNTPDLGLPPQAPAGGTAP